MAGGYDEGYEACPCFWGREPGSLVLQLMERVGSVSGWRVLDAGCGEGKNAVYLAERGADVVAVDVSVAAIRNARQAWNTPRRVEWAVADVGTLAPDPGTYDLVIAYGLFHCLPDRGAIASLVARLQAATRPGGYHIVCAFNDRYQDLSAHPGFRPTFLSHDEYVRYYRSWSLLHESDRDLNESHPSNQIPHTHSMTRIIAQRMGEQPGGSK